LDSAKFTDHMKRTLLAAAILLLSVYFICAQSSSTGAKNEYSVWGGYSPDSLTWIPAFGRTPDARFGIVAFRYARRFNNGDSVNLKYTADIAPLVVLNFPDQLFVPPVRKTGYAFGVTPLGIQANFRPHKKYQPFGTLAGGFMWFNKQIPNELGTKFNFTADIGGGVEIKVRETRAISIGYKYYHISNGGRGQINPGFDNNLFYLGYTFFRN
jgi:hypothetical protein